MEVVQGRSSGTGVLRVLRRLQERQEQDDVGKSIEGLEHDVAVQFEQLMEQHRTSKSQGQGGQGTALLLPSFFKPKPKVNSLASLVKQRARLRKEQLKQDMSDDGPLRQINFLVQEYSSCPLEDEQQQQMGEEGANLRINYDGFTQVASRCREMFGPVLSTLFKASVFQMFEPDEEGGISARHFIMYLNSKSAMVQMRVHLSKFDPDNCGSLSEPQLEEFLDHFSSTVPALDAVPDWFRPMYKRIAARKLLFFHGHNSKVRIKDLLNSHTLADLSELKLPGQNEEQLVNNWFSLQSTMRVYNTFQRLDVTGRNSLDLHEFSQISGATMSPLFLERIFQEHIMTRRPPGADGPPTDPMSAEPLRDRMDLLDFTDFVLAWDHRASPAAVKYFFPIFDLQKKGVITPYELYVFFKEIHLLWVHVLGDYADLNIYDVVDELLDMMRPKEPPNISQEDLRISGMSGTFFACLADAKLFRDYNYRENTMHQDDNQ